MTHMKRAIVGTLIALALPASAQAGSSPQPFVPAGNSAANEYVEVVPTAGGGQSTSPLTHTGTKTSAARQVSPLPQGAQTAFSQQGSDGTRAAAFARATAPASVRHRAHHAGAVAGSSGGSGPGSGSTGAGPAGTPVSASGGPSLLRAVTGAGTSGGLGSMLPVVLGLSALAVAGAALRRRRTS